MSDYDKGPESKRFFGRISKRTAAIIGGTLLWAALVLDVNDKPESGIASCDTLSVTTLDSSKHIIEVQPSFHVTGDAKFAGISYRFDEDDLPRGFVGPNRVQHDYPDSPANQTYTITAVVNYRLNGKVFGGVPVCSTEITFNEQQNG